MINAPRQRVLRFFLCAVLIIQTMVPGVAVAANSPQFDTASLICAPSGRISNETIAALEDFLDLTEREEPRKISSGAHCPFCSSPQSSALPPPPLVVSAIDAWSYLGLQSFNDKISVGAYTGSPLGVRAPPFLTKSNPEL